MNRKTVMSVNIKLFVTGNMYGQYVSDGTVKITSFVIYIFQHRLSFVNFIFYFSYITININNHNIMKAQLRDTLFIKT